MEFLSTSIPSPSSTRCFALVCTILVLLLAIDYRKILARFTTSRIGKRHRRILRLPVFVCAGMMWMASANDLAGASSSHSNWSPLPSTSSSPYMRRNVGSLEAGVKYLILGALSTGFLVYGIAWVYGTTGT